MKNFLALFLLLVALPGFGAQALLFTNANTLFVNTNGNDATAFKGTASQPYKTLFSAKAAAVAGDTVMVMPGTYVCSNLLKGGVNWFLSAGVLLTNFNSSNYYGFAPGIFDDRLSGAVTSSITGYGSLGFLGNHYSNTTTLGAVVVTNAGTKLTASFESVTASFADGGQNSAAFWLEAGTNNVSVRTVTDPYRNINIGWAAPPAEEEPPDAIPSHVFGFYIAQGDQTIFCDLLRPDNSTTETAITVTNTGYLRLMVNAKRIGNGWTEGLCKGDRAVDVDSATTNADIFVYAEEIARYRVINSTGSRHTLRVGRTCALWFFGSLNADILAGDVISDCALGGGLQLGSAAGGSPTVYAQVTRVSDRGDGDAPVQVSSGTLRLIATEVAASQVLRGTPGGTEALFVSGGKAYVEATLRASSTNNAILVSGGTLLLRNCTIIAGSGKDSITAASAKTVGIYGHCIANTAKNANITLSPLGAFTVDSNVQ